MKNVVSFDQDAVEDLTWGDVIFPNLSSSDVEEDHKSSRTNAMNYEVPENILKLGQQRPENKISF